MTVLSNRVRRREAGGQRGDLVARWIDPQQAPIGRPSVREVDDVQALTLFEQLSQKARSAAGTGRERDGVLHLTGGIEHADVRLPGEGERRRVEVATRVNRDALRVRAGASQIGSEVGDDSDDRLICDSIDTEEQY